MAGAALTRAAQLWSLLDEMAENEPQAYRRLLQQQRAEAERFCAAPEPHLCLRARPAGGVGRPLFINVCSWRRVPAPKGPAGPTPVSAGPLEVSGEGELTLDELLHTMGAEDCSNASVLLKEESVTQSKGHLIEEIASTEMPEKLSTPVYEMITVKDANKKPLKIELRIELPKVSSVSECELRISKDDIIIEVPEKYKLQLDLPELVDEETTTAVFNKGKRVLFITVLVAKPDP
ncbi:PIH1 domain-containing protein 2 isoform X2 [Strigops habroptila]|uniref:PIH1 domain-containing protein 2 isoform X2 n=1 Tax=Strigops habroptila TaxID=2489341 RepID=UPI0011CFFFB5|nr:PIH1 domain-containing protein 2 isoform X2 [Strigops habroptila]